MATIQTFEELECWKEAAALRRAIRATTKCFPEEEKFRLTDQLIRSSRSIAANLAEGFGRFTYKENSRYCFIARGSLCETLDHLIVATEEKYIAAEDLAAFRLKITKCLKLINGYINYLSDVNQKNKVSKKTKIINYLYFI